MKTLWQRIGEQAQRRAQWLLLCFAISLLVLNWGRWSAWDSGGFLLYLTHPIMQTTLWDFAWVLGILTLFVHQDAKKHQLRYWYILPTFPIMPTVGLLLYLWMRHRQLSKRGSVVPLGA